MSVDDECQKLGFSFLMSNDIIFSKNDAINYLTEPNLEKDNINRLISWLMVLDIIPDDHIDSASHLNKLLKLFNSLKVKYFKVNENPHDCLPTKESHVITADINRSFLWFIRLAKELGIDISTSDNTKDTIVEILVLIALVPKKYKYIQGFDRFTLVSFLLATTFTHKYQLSNNVAAAISFFLTRKILSIVDISKILDDEQSREKRFGYLDQLLQIYTPDIVKHLTKCGTTAIHFALRWHLVLFADEHNIRGMLYIWDNAFANYHNYLQYIQYLSVAHVIQVQREPFDNDNSNLIVSHIHHYDKWDEVELVKMANTLAYSHNKVSRFDTLNYLIALIVLSIMSASLYLFIKSGK